MKDRLLLLILSILLFLPLSCVAEESITPNTDTVTSVVQTEENINVEPLQENIKPQSPVAENDVSEMPYKQPISKLKLLKKFLMAMFAVGISSVALYAGLTIYNRVRDGQSVQIKTPEGETPLSSPDTIENAAKIFIEKTKWV